jgi:uncharacterized repeat protein (TIGR01451 family)
VIVALAAGVLCAPAAAQGPASADLAVTKVDSPDPVGPGQNITYTIAVTNNGPDTASNVTLTDALPANTTFVSASQQSGPAFTLTTPAAGAGGTFTATSATMAAGASAVFTLVVQVDPGTPPATTISNTASVSTTSTDVNGANDDSTALTTVSPLADVAVQKDDDADPVSSGDNITYTINVANNGPSDAQSVQLSDSLPAGTTFVSFSAPVGWTVTAPAVGAGGTVTATTPTLAFEDAAQFTLVVHVDPGVAHGTVLNNTANISSSTPDPTDGNDSDTETTEVNEVADLGVTKSGTPTTVRAGDDITYTLDLANAGPATAEDVGLSDAVPAGTTFVSASQVSGPSFTLTSPAAGAGGTFTATRSTLAQAASARFRMVVRVNGDAADGSTITNTARSHQLTFDPDDSNDSASTGTSVTNPPPPGVGGGPPATAQPRPPRLTIGDARMRTGSGVVFVPLTCEFHPRDVCVTDVTLTFNTVFHKLDPITVRDVHIGGGQSLDLYMAASKAQRRKMKRIGTMPITVTATNAPAGDVVKQGLLHGAPRRQR